MSAKRFHISTPEELKELAEFAKERPNRLNNIALFWTSMKRKGETFFDHSIFCGFSGSRKRKAEIVRITSCNELEICAELKYNLALQWCEGHLREVYDI